MKKIYLLQAFLFTAFFASPLFAQTYLTGVVTGVVDGRTLIVKNAQDKEATVRLRYIEVPEPGQQLSDTVSDHLKKLAMGKPVKIGKIRLLGSYTLGTVETANADLSLQMLRDGAAWFDKYDSDASSDITALYEQAESLAKDEKRGVWGIPNLIPAWQYRLEKTYGKDSVMIGASKRASQKSDEELGLSEMVKASTAENPNLVDYTKLGIYDFKFSDKKSDPAERSSGGPFGNASAGSEGRGSGGGQASTAGNKRNGFDLNHFYNSQANIGAVATPTMEFKLKIGSSQQDCAFAFGYNYQVKNNQKDITHLRMVIAARILNKKFLQGKAVSVVLDNGKKISIGSPQYLIYGSAELYNFESVKWEDLAAFAESSSATIIIGKFKYQIEKKYKDQIDTFIAALNEQ